MANSSINPSLPLPHQCRSSSEGPVAILWDIENCPVPSDVRPEDVAGNIRMALRVHPIIDGAVTLFSAYGDFNAFPRRVREGCQRTGVKLVDVPNGRKDAADKAILVDMFLFALDNPPPSSIMLISGDVDFAPALHILGQRGYTVILAIPSRLGVSSALSNAGRFLWDWPTVAHGEGFVPPARALMPSCSSPAEIAGVLMGCQSSESVEGQNEESIVYMGVSKRCNSTRDSSMASRSQMEFGTSSILVGQNTITKDGSYCDRNDLSWVQPGDLNGLKGQLVQLLGLLGGRLPLARLPAEYQKLYGRPLYVSEYGSFKLVNLLKKMVDVIGIEGKSQRKFVRLRTSKSEPAAPPVILARRDNMKGRRSQEDNTDIKAGAGSSDELSDDERVVVGENVHWKVGEKLGLKETSCSRIIEQNLDKFKYKLQEILVSYSCRIFLSCLEAVYQQKYKGKLDFLSFGVNNLEELLEKVSDVVVLQEEPLSKRKFLVAIGG